MPDAMRLRRGHGDPLAQAGAAGLGSGGARVAGVPLLEAVLVVLAGAARAWPPRTSIAAVQ